MRRLATSVIGCAVLALLAAPSSAGTRDEVQAAARRLRQTASSLQPLPDTGSGITRDVGDIAIVEHDGSSYDDRLPDGTLNYEARTRVGLSFYLTHGDNYDFLVVFTNFEFKTGDATAFHLFGRNEVEGIGKPVGAVAPIVFGSPARLKGWIDMAAVSRYRQRPYSVTPGDLGFLQTLNVLAHEVGHQWLAEARFVEPSVNPSDPPVVSSDLLGSDDVHWSYLLDSDASLLYGADWRRGEDGAYRAVRVKDIYSALDRYLMGFLAPEKVSSFTLLRNPSIDRHLIDREGDIVQATPETVVLDQVIAAMGSRRPDSLHSQKEFRLGFVFLTAPATEPSAEDLDAVERVRRAFGAHFFALTQGVAVADTSLAEAPPAPRAVIPDLDRALAWLLAQQGLDGVWADSPETRLRDTSAAVDALRRAGLIGPAWQRGVTSLQQAQPESLDFQARRAAAVAGLLGPPDRSTLASQVLSLQGVDGGFGAGPDFASDGFDTALALRALRALGQPADGQVRRAVEALAILANPDGGWSSVPGGETSTVVTAQVLLALQDWPEVQGASALLFRGLAALLARRNPDGGFGTSPSTPLASALVLDVLLRAGSDTDEIASVTAWLQQAQLADGSWEGSRFQTALVLGALRESLGANLTVPADSLVVAPSPAHEGDTVHVTARVRNAGRTAAPASVARLYDGDPASSLFVGEAAVPGLASGEEAGATFDYPTVDEAGPHTLYVVADAANQVPESREDDNTTSRSLTVEGLLADLVVTPFDIAVAPSAPEVGEAAAIAVTVANRGERASAECLLRVGVTDPSGRSVYLPDAMLPALGPGQGMTISVPWTPTSVGDQVIRATADAAYQVPESDETNNSGDRRVLVVDAAPAGPDLAVVSPVLVPDTLVTLPQEIEVRALVENHGRSSVVATVAVFDGYWGGVRLGTAPIQLGPRSTVPIALRVTIQTPGDRALAIVADPDSEIAEADEANNAATAVLHDARTVDLELVAASVALSSADVEVGETLTVTFDVRNHGTVDVPRVPVQLAHVTDAGPAELARADIEVPAGGAQTVTLSWRALIVGDAVPLLLRVDPFELLRETREDNNAASLSLRVRPSSLPNLAVSSLDITVAPAPPVEGQPASVSALVRNTGGVQAGPFTVRFFVGDPDWEGRSIGEVSVSSLDAGAAATASIEWSPVDARGALGLYVVVDALQQVEESVETDNRAYRAFSALGLPDLVLAMADVVLEPGYPRIGEAVTIHSTVHNLGDRPSSATSLTVSEGEPAATVLGDLPIPELAPGASAVVTLAWTPASSPGMHVLRFTLDPEGLVVEHDEGNNVVRKTVVVQDPDLYLTNPFFSPNGDGVMDDTTLAWRAAEPAQVVVSDPRGRTVKTVITGAGGSASATWDGRDERGVVAPDGVYALSLLGNSGDLLGRVDAVVDTNRSPLHQALLGRTTLRNLTCGVPPVPFDFQRRALAVAWMPAEDEVLYVVPSAQPGFPIGLLRVGLDGGFAYVAQDDWYAGATVASQAAVSPDGREVLLVAGGELFSVDLATGARRSVGTAGGNAVIWSPDGRFILNGPAVLNRDGSAEGDLGPGEWAWSPGSDRLASTPNWGDSAGGELTIVARDGTQVDSILLPRDEGDPSEFGWGGETVWRGDGTVVANVWFCEEYGSEPSCRDASYLVDPESRGVRRLPFSAFGAAWSPDGTRVLLPDGDLRLEDGTSLGKLVPYRSSFSYGFSVSPRATVAFFNQVASGTGPGALVCPGKYADTLVFGGLTNLVTSLQVARLPGATGMVLRGTVGDLNLDHFEIDFADRKDPTVWHPIGPASDVPVVDEQLAAWVPPAPGTYLVRLTVADRAGNSRAVTRLVPWDRFPALTTFTQSVRLFSPNGGGVKTVEFHYTALLQTTVDIRVAGPDPEATGAPAAQEVLRSVFEHIGPGPQVFAWDGRDSSGQFVPDGWYTVLINGLPLRVEVDNTPPEIGLRWVAGPSAGPMPVIVGGEVRPGGNCVPLNPVDWPTPSPTVGLAGVVATRSMYVVDRNLNYWLSPWDFGAHLEPVYIPDMDASGGPVFEGGRPRVRRENGRPVGREDDALVGRDYPPSKPLHLEARDYAGNVSVLEADPPPEAVVPLGAISRCEALASPLEPEPQPPGPDGPVAELTPDRLFLQGGSTLHRSATGPARFELQPRGGGGWREVGRTSSAMYDTTTVHINSFEALGLDPTAVYRGRFRAQGVTGELSSQPFLFCPCKWRLKADVLLGPNEALHVVLRARLEAPVVEARADVALQFPYDNRPLGTVLLAPLSRELAQKLFGLTLDAGEEAWYAPLPPFDRGCGELRVSVGVRDRQGATYPSDKIERACQQLNVEQPSACHLQLFQDFPYCGGKPELLYVSAWGHVEAPVRVTIEGGPKEAPVPVDTFEFVPAQENQGNIKRKYEVPVGGVSGGTYPFRGKVIRLELPEIELGPPAELLAVIDRQSPVGEVVDPSEGRAACLTPKAQGPELSTRVRFLDDKSPTVSAPVGSWRFVDGPWGPLQQMCRDDFGQPHGCPTAESTGVVHEMNWSASQLENGWHDIRLDFCDRSGNKASTARHIFVTRDPPSLQTPSVSPRVFSPNGDGRAEQTLVTVRLSEPAALTASVHAGDRNGPVVRTLMYQQPEATTDAAVFWDGRGDNGQRVTDGVYAIVFSAADSCGGTGDTFATVEVDTTPPDVAITDPGAGQRVSAGVDVRGRAADAHFSSWELDVLCGGSGDWTRVATGKAPITNGSFVARWDSSRAPPGECRLRLTAEDEVGNRSAEAIVTVQVERGDLLLRLAATPDVFSPNGDGRRETTTLEYELARKARVRLQVRDGAGHVLRTFEDAVLHEAGVSSHVWDGLNDAAGPAPEGDHVLWIRAEDPDVPSVYEEKTTRIVIDRTPPGIAITRPVAGGFAPSSGAVLGSITDQHLAEYTITVTPAGGAPIELAHAFQARTDADLAPLATLAEGPHTLRVVATDLAENETALDVPFVMDSTPPRAAIQSPPNGAFLRGGDTPILVLGTALDDHLEGWTLRFGPGAEPAGFTEVAKGTTGGSGMPLGPWDVRYVPDGVYTLSLVARDLAGLVTEARVTVTLDTRPPTVTLTAPAEGSYVAHASAVVGTAMDVNLASWHLEAAPGAAASAYQWTALGDGTASVEAGTLAEWSPLPPDGVYTLRLTARDKVDLTASTRTTVTVDTTPPATPTGLKATVTKAREGYGNVRVTWNANTEPDLAGYHVSRDGTPLDTDPLTEPAWNDGERIEGRYVYSVVAFDKAGNVSLPAKLTVLVDLTPPTLAFISPLAGASVSGSVTVRGTAYSADDFAEYRLFVGAGEAPTLWTPIQRSSVPVAAGRLGDWLALADGPYVLALEADDTHGNSARITRAVVVDTQPPEPPVLVEVAHPSTPADRLVPRWQPSPSADVAGYLVYRNGRLANAVGIVLGDLRGYLVPGLTYDDDGLADGKHCYRVVAMDGAGNESVPSNEVCQSLDNRPPAAVIVQPPDKTRFGYPVRVVAYTQDLDVARIRFELSAAGAGQWRELSVLEWAPDQPIPPWETTLDPDAQQLTPGDYDLRAVATDLASKTDPAPAAIRVTYGDTTPPPPPEGLVARVDGADVALAWTASTASDFASYRLYRDGTRIAEDLSEARYMDPGLAPETYAYTVTAVDRDGNESGPSAPAEAVVYAVRLQEPAWPVVEPPSATVRGDGSRPQTTVKVLREGTAVAEGAASGGAFHVDAVPLVDEGNVLRAQGEDAAGNRSIPSNEIVLIANTPPGPVTDLEAAVDAHAVSLGWTPVGDADLFGYLVRRDGQALTGARPQGDGAWFEASTSPEIANLAFDDNPATAWPWSAATGEWSAIFPAPILVERVHVRFAPDAGVPVEGASGPAHYTVLARWQGHYVPLVRVTDNAQLVADHVLPAPFATDSLRVALESPGRLAEVTVDRLDVVPAASQSYADTDVPDGRHTYAVTAIDRYGAEGAAGSAEAAVGDVAAPSTPTGLVATPQVRDVLLTWNKNPEPDVARYVVVRDGARIGTSPTPAYRDPGLPNGTYRYTVLAVDEAGNESPESDPADATIAVMPVPPAAPVIVQPTTADEPITLEVTRTNVAGRADAGSVVALDVNGEARGMALSAPGFLGQTSALLGADQNVAFSPDGRLAAWIQYSGPVSVQDLASGDVRTYQPGGEGAPAHLVFSPDGTTLALTRFTYIGPSAGYRPEVVLLSLADGSVRSLADGSAADIAWSPDGSRLALSFDEAEGTSLHVLDVATGTLTEMDRSAGTDSYLRWSPDGARLAFVRSWWGAAAQLQVVTLDGGSIDVLDEQPWPYAVPDWSTDGRRLAWTTGDRQPLRVRVYDFPSRAVAADVAETGADTVDARFSPSGEWLSFVRFDHLDDGRVLRTIVARHLQSGTRVTVTGPEERWDTALPDTHEWLGGRLGVRSESQLDLFSTVPGRFLFPDVPLVPGENQLVARATDPTTALVSPDSETVFVTVPEGDFPDLAVEASGVDTIPPVSIAERPAQLRVRVDNVGAVDAGETSVRVSVVDPAGDLVLDTTATLSGLSSGATARVSVPWTPASAGSHTVSVAVDPDGAIAEAREDNNTAERSIQVLAAEGLAAEIASDKASYPARSAATVTVHVVNAGPPFGGTARTTVEDATGGEVVALDDRAVALEYGGSVSYTLPWNTGTTWAGSYAFRVRVRAEGEEAESASASRTFTIEPDLEVAAGVLPQPAFVPAGAAAAFALHVDNHGTNALLEGASVRLSVQPEGSSGPATFATVRALPTLVPGGSWDGGDVWPAAQPPGGYAVTLLVEGTAGAALANASATLTVEAGTAVVQGTLAVAPGDVLAGQTAQGQVTLANSGTAAAAGYPVVVELVSGPEATVHASVPGLTDLAVGETRSLSLTIETSGVAPASYVARLRGGTPLVSLDRTRLVVHGVIAPPSPHAPADGGKVDTAHPALVVNNASSLEGAALTYEFQLFGDAALTQALPGATGIKETLPRTSWRVAAALAEDATCWWRARATDGFSTSPWSTVVSFTVDAENRPPTAPVPDTPAPGARVASRQPNLAVRNANDPEHDTLSYGFRLATRSDMADVIAAASGIAEGLGLTSWTVPLVLDEDAVYYWSARASDGVNLSPWSEAVSFRVDTVNESPTAPVPLRPVGGLEVATTSPALVVQDATDPEGDVLIYRFEIDSRPSFDSPERQVSPDVPEGAGETSWTPPAALGEDTLYFWRASASDGNTSTPSPIASFFVNVTNEPPEAPVPLDPVEGRVVGTATPTLRLRNAVDPENDALSYELEVRDAGGALVAAVAGVPSGDAETTWTVTPPLTEDRSYTWTARASDGELTGPRSAPAAFRVDAVAEPPTAPTPYLPEEGAAVENRRPELVVQNATSPDGRPLTYTFELYARAADGTSSLVEQVTGIPEAPETTAWTPSSELADGTYEWRARASDPLQAGPWSATARFEVRVDVPPAAPTGLNATPGDRHVVLTWNASPETDVTGYRVYRATASGGPYDLVGPAATHAFDDIGLTNGVTYYYVVTALDAHHESPHSAEAAARPEAPMIVVEVRYDPSTIEGECLLTNSAGNWAVDSADRALTLRLLGGRDRDLEALTGPMAAPVSPSCPPPDQGCPKWLYATLEMPPGHDPATIDVASLRLLGSVSADPAYRTFVDVDRDGLPELRVRFRFERVAPLLVIGVNEATIVGRAGSSEVQGSREITVSAIEADMRVTPRTINRRSCGEDIKASLTFAEGVSARDVSISSVRLNEVVAVDRVVRAKGRDLVVKFDRAAVNKILPLGEAVEVRVTGTLRGLAFVAVDHVRVIE